MRVVVVGASGNVGTSVLDALAGDPDVDSILGLSRRRPEVRVPKAEWATADVAEDDLESHFRGADAVIHLAWAIQPSRDDETLRRVNVEGSARVLDATARAEVPALVYASSVGAYSAGPKDRKAAVERMLDEFEAGHEGIRVVRLRPGLTFKREAASEIRRYFIGPLLPSPLLHDRLIPAVPDLPRLRFQAVHSRDVGEAYRLAVKTDARGAFNVAAEPVLDPERLADLLGARRVTRAARATSSAGSPRSAPRTLSSSSSTAFGRAAASPLPRSTPPAAARCAPASSPPAWALGRKPTAAATVRPSAGPRGLPVASPACRPSPLARSWRSTSRRSAT